MSANAKIPAEAVWLQTLCSLSLNSNIPNTPISYVAYSFFLSLEQPKEVTFLASQFSQVEPMNMKGCEPLAPNPNSIVKRWASHLNPDPFWSQSPYTALTSDFTQFLPRNVHHSRSITTLACLYHSVVWHKSIQESLSKAFFLTVILFFTQGNDCSIELDVALATEFLFCLQVLKIYRRRCISSFELFLK